MSATSSTSTRVPTSNEWLLMIVVSALVAGFVWWELLTGGGLVGGDTYPYFFPQKQLMVEAFQRDDLPIWHDRTSLGYPLHAESQLGLFYPTNQILYRVFKLNTAYNISIILHYIAAFVLTWRFALSQRLSFGSSILAATAFVYGWFPARLSLEWSIIGGVWFPACLWATQRLIERPNVNRWLVLCTCFAVHLLAGHFTLAFITQLTCVVFAALVSPNVTGAANAAIALTTETSSGRPSALVQSFLVLRWKMVFRVMLSIAMAVLLASVQLVPTLELRQLSQRDGSNAAFNPGYGHMPPVYLSQLIASWWFWHTEDMVVTRGMTQYPLLMSSADTNQVEAHLYVGLIPLALLLGLLNHRVRYVLRTSPWKHWLIISTLAVIYSFGWLVPLFRHLPGFGFFMGPGRYTMITAMGLALVAGLVLDAWNRKRSPVVRTSFAVVIAAITLIDVLKSSEPPVRDAQIVATPPLNGLEDSWIARTLKVEDKTSPVRLLAPGPNIGNLFGVSSAPQYLGLGPAEYFAEDNRLQTMPGNPDDVFPSDDLRSRLHRYAITHILTMEPLKNPSDDLELIQAAPDSFLNRVWGRGSSACFLYRLDSARSRVTANPSGALASLKYRLRTPEALELEVLLESPAVIEVCELMFQGWHVSIDGTDVSAETSSGFGRFVKVPEGRHIIQWSYRPTSFRVGLGGTSLGIVLAACILWVNRRRRHRT